MAAVLKYKLKHSIAQEVQLPSGAKPLCFRFQNDQPMLWALVDPLCPSTPYHVVLAITGADIDVDGYTYIGTDESLDGIVRHCFIRKLP